MIDYRDNKNQFCMLGVLSHQYLNMPPRKPDRFATLRAKWRTVCHRVNLLLHGCDCERDYYGEEE